jgi:large subunit ribosomal protein L35
MGLPTSQGWPWGGLDDGIEAANWNVIMPKQKTHKGTKKRFRLTAKGKAKHRMSGTSHLLSRMSTKRKRNLRGTTTTANADAKRIRKALCGNSY